MANPNSEVTVVLDDIELWTKFFECGTEMIINRAGRRMFPSVSIFVRGLEMTSVYVIALSITPADDSRYKFINNRWIAVGRADPPISNRPFVHGDSPQTGAQWMREKISFSRLKITNNKERIDDNIVLHSMHKYVACVTITKVTSTGVEARETHLTFTIPLTAFVAVTAYQNENITQLKIRNNPFAKAFRDVEVTNFIRQGMPSLFSNKWSPFLNHWHPGLAGADSLMSKTIGQPPFLTYVPPASFGVPPEFPFYCGAAAAALPLLAPQALQWLCDKEQQQQQLQQQQQQQQTSVSSSSLPQSSTTSASTSATTSHRKELALATTVSDVTTAVTSSLTAAIEK